MWTQQTRFAVKMFEFRKKKYFFSHYLKTPDATTDRSQEHFCCCTRFLCWIIIFGLINVIKSNLSKSKLGSQIFSAGKVCVTRRFLQWPKNGWKACWRRRRKNNHLFIYSFIHQAIRFLRIKMFISFFMFFYWINLYSFIVALITKAELTYSKGKTIRSIKVQIIVKVLDF